MCSLQDPGKQYSEDATRQLLGQLGSGRRYAKARSGVVKAATPEVVSQARRGQQLASEPNPVGATGSRQYIGGVEEDGWTAATQLG